MSQKRWIGAAAASLAVSLLCACQSDVERNAAVRPTMAETHRVEVEADRVKDYSNLRQLTADSTIVVVGHQDGALRLNPYYGDATTPFAILPFRVESGLMGAEPGSTIEISVEAGFDSSGQVVSSKLNPSTTYLLYLTPQGPKSPTVYTIVGYKAGIFKKISATDFVRQDSDSPALPTRVTLQQAQTTVSN